MIFDSMRLFLSWGKKFLLKGPHAIILAEDQIELTSTVRHHLAQQFKTVIVIGKDVSKMLVDVTDPAVIQIDDPIMSSEYAIEFVNSIINLVPGQWLFYGFNAEYLFYPFCESRTITDLVAFLTEERRNATVSFVVDLYAGNLAKAPDAVDYADTYFDRSGYYGLNRTERDGSQLDRQMDFFGGLKRRFEEYIPKNKRKIDRIALFKAAPKLKLRRDFTFDHDEYNTISCPWHNNTTTSIASYRTAKALKRNPSSTFDIDTFKWQNSKRFDWNSQQIMDLGLMEPGQWF